MITFLCFALAIVFGPLPVLGFIYLAITTRQENHNRRR